ncbi:MAG: HPF/RaiA family ribosome-associated protein [Gammaproteobacteria bacterium]
MKLDIQARDFSLTDSIQTYVKERINYLFGARYDQIQRITVRLGDVNGPRGGVDKRCRVKITLPRLNEIVIEDVQTDLYVAISRAMERASRTVIRRLNRLLDKKRRLYVPNSFKTQVFKDNSLAYN